MLATLYELQIAVEEAVINTVVDAADFVTLIGQHVDLDEMILAAGGRSATVLNY